MAISCIVLTLDRCLLLSTVPSEEIMIMDRADRVGLLHPTLRAAYSVVPMALELLRACSR